MYDEGQQFFSRFLTRNRNTFMGLSSNRRFLSWMQGVLCARSTRGELEISLNECGGMEIIMNSESACFSSSIKFVKPYHTISATG
jgi:hypothetical protein